MPTVWNWKKKHKFNKGIEEAWIAHIRKNPPPLRSGKRWNNNQATLTEEGGLGLLVTRTSAVYVVRVTFEGSKCTWRIPRGTRDLMDLKTARRRAVAIRDGASDGIHVKKQHWSGGVTFGSLVEPYMKNLRSRTRSKENQKGRERFLRVACNGRSEGEHSFPGLGNLLLSEVTARRFSKISEFYRNRNTPGAERAIHFAIKGVLAYAVERGLMEEEYNPIHGWRPPPANEREGVLSRDEFVKVQEGLDAYARDEKNHPSGRQAALAFLFKSKSGARTSEAERLKRSEVRLAANEVLIREHKTVDKNPAPRRIPLTPSAKKIIKRALTLAPDSEYVFGSPVNPKRHLDLQRARCWKAVCKKVGVDITGLGGVGLLRRSFLTLFVDIGGLMSTQKVAGHTKLETTKRYLERASFAQVLRGLQELERRLAENVCCGVCSEPVSEVELERLEFPIDLDGVKGTASIWYCTITDTCKRIAMKRAAEVDTIEEKAA